MGTGWRTAAVALSSSCISMGGSVCMALHVVCVVPAHHHGARVLGFTGKQHMGKALWMGSGSQGLGTACAGNLWLQACPAAARLAKV
jgi:hypothetical protein